MELIKVIIHALDPTEFWELCLMQKLAMTCKSALEIYHNAILPTLRVRFRYYSGIHECCIPVPLTYQASNRFRSGPIVIVYDTDHLLRNPGPRYTRKISAYRINMMTMVATWIKTKYI